MYRIGCAALCAAVCVCVGIGTSAPAFAVDRPVCFEAEIALPAVSNGVERFAAEELAYHLERAYGVRPAVLKESVAAKSAAASHVYLGATKAARAAGLPGRELADEERVVAVRGNALFLLGQDRDTTYGETENPWPIASRGTLKQGKTRFVAYIDANGDGVADQTGIVSGVFEDRFVTIQGDLATGNINKSRLAPHGMARIVQRNGLRFGVIHGADQLRTL